MLLVTLEDDDCANGGAFVFIGAVALAIAKAKGSANILDAERKMFSLVNGAVQSAALNPRDPENLAALSRSDYGHGIVALEELASWGRGLSLPLDFKLAQNGATPIAVGAAVPDAPEPAPESPVRMTKADRQRMNDFFAESLRRSQRLTEAAAIARTAELARLNARDEYEASKARQQRAPAQATPKADWTDQTEALGIGGDATSDPERRLALLRKLGGAAKYFRGDWSFTGIAALVASEKREGRERMSEKTIRADLKKAAQNERDAKSAGFADGLGQR